MEKDFWPIEKAGKHIRNVSYIIIGSGIFTVFFSVKRFIALGTSAFIIPYLSNILDALFGIFELYVGKALRQIKSWTRGAVFFIAGIKIIFGFFFDAMEAIIMLIVFFYFIYVLKNSSAGWCFKSNIENHKGGT